MPTRTTRCSPDQLRKLVDLVIETLDEPLSGDELARRAHLGRFYLSHLVKAGLGESLAAFRRRLLLERAAHQLATSEHSVIYVACAAGYGSPEAFTHAFRRAFAIAPSDFRADGETRYHLDAPNGIHYFPPAPGERVGGGLTTQLVEHDNRLTATLLDRAIELTDAELDEPVKLCPPTSAFASRAPSIRTMLSEIVAAKERAAAKLSGRGHAPPGSTTSELVQRLRVAAETLEPRVAEIESRDCWSTSFADTTVDPVTTTTFGDVVAELLTAGVIRHEIAASALAAKGAGGVRLALGPESDERRPPKLAA